MATLHLVNKTPAHDAFTRCLTMANPGDTVLLVEDGVYCALRASLSRTSIDGIRMLALRTDAEARGVQSMLAPDIALVSERDFVQLVVDHQPVVTWSSS